MASRFSLRTLQVLKTFVDSPALEWAGADLIRHTGTFAGTLYPILIRLEQEGILASRWEEERPQDLGRPRRRLYSLTGEGARVARSALMDFAPATFTATPVEGLS